MGLKDIRLIGTTSAGGAVNIDGEAHVLGILEAVQWVDGSFDNGVDAVLSVIQPDGTAQTLLTLTDANDDAWLYPRVPVNDPTGAALDDADGANLTKPLLVGKPRLAITSGGNAKTGGCILYYWS